MRDVLRGTLPAAGVSLGWFRTLRDGTCSRLVFSHGCSRCHICDVRPCCRLPSRPTHLRCCGIAWSESSSIGQLGPPKQNTVDSTTGVYAFLTALGARSPRSKRQQARFLPRAPSLARGRPPSCCVRTWSSLCAHAHPVSLCVQIASSYKDTRQISSGHTPTVSS